MQIINAIVIDVKGSEHHSTEQHRETWITAMVNEANQRSSKKTDQIEAGSTKAPY